MKIINKPLRIGPYQHQYDDSNTINILIPENNGYAYNHSKYSNNDLQVTYFTENAAISNVGLNL